MFVQVVQVLIYSKSGCGMIGLVLHLFRLFRYTHTYIYIYIKSGCGMIGVVVRCSGRYTVNQVWNDRCGFAFVQVVQVVVY